MNGLRHTFNILRKTLLIIFTLLVILLLAVQTDTVQNVLVKFAAEKLSKSLGTEVSIKKVSLSFFSQLNLEGTLLRDKQKDTLLYANKLKVNITDWFFFKDKAYLKYIGLENAVVKLVRKNEVWNYQFMVDFFDPPGPKKKKKQGSIELNLQKIDLKNIRLIYHDYWVGSLTTVQLGGLTLNADKVDLNKNSYIIDDITLNKPAITLQDLPGLRPTQKNKLEHPSIDTGRYFNQAGISLLVKQIKIINGKLFIEGNTKKAGKGFDESHIEMSALNGTLQSVSFKEDTLTAKINLSVKDRSGFELKKLSSNFKLTPQIMEFAKLDLRTNKSVLGNYYAMKFKDFTKDFSDYINKVEMVANFTNAKLSSDDIAYFASELKDWKKQVIIGGKFNGTVANFKVEQFNARIGATTHLNGNLSMKGLPDIEKTFIQFSNGTLNTTAYDLGVFIPALKNIEQPNLAALGNILYRGNFKGTIQNFNTTGVFSTKLGGIQSNISLQLPNKGEPVFTGVIGTTRFNLGKFINNDQLGLIDFKGKVKGSSFNIDRLNTKFDGTISSIDFNNYTYTNIIANGNLQRKSFNGELEIDDPNLAFTSNVEIDFRKSQPLFNIVGDLSKANLKALHFIRDKIEIAGLLDVNFTGKDLDNFTGSAKFLNATIKNEETSLQFDSLNLSSTYKDTLKTLRLGSNDFNATISGKYNIKELPASFQAFLHNYYPAYVKSPKTTPKNQQFKFSATTQYIEPYLRLFTKKISGFNDAIINGSVDTKNIALGINAYIPYGKYDNYSAIGFQLDGKGNFDSLTVVGNIKSIEVGDSLKLPNTLINIRSSNDHSVVSIKTSATNTLNDAALLADVYTLEDGVRVQFRPSTFVLNEKIWSIGKSGEIIARKNLLHAQDMKFTQGFQEITVETEEEDGGNTSNLVVKLKNVILGDITSLFLKEERLEGLTTGTIRLNNFFGDFAADASLQAEEFRFGKDSIGLVNIKAGYNSKSGLIPFKIVSANKGYDLTAKGSYNVKDSTGKSFNTDIQLNQTKINIIERFLSDLFTDISGEATGKLNISGDINAPNLLGKLLLKNAGMKVNYTQVYYNIDSAVVKFDEDGIDFGQFIVKDKYGNTGNITGKLFEKGFSNLVFDFDLSTDKMLLIDTKLRDNKQFYGKAIGKANLSFKGPESAAKMSLTAEANDSSHIYLPNSVTKESGAADFIVFKEYGTEMDVAKPKSNFNLLVDLEIIANNKVMIDVILDDVTGDVIKAVGNGRLKIRAGTAEPLTIKGRYNIERGKYDFNFQSILKKPFELLPDAGNYIEWNGDPFKAELHIDAQYTAERISLTDLIGNNIFSGSVKGYRGDVYVIAALRSQLSNPDIKFRLDFPQGSPVKNDNEFSAFLSRIQRDENEILKQVSFLIVFGSFAPPGESKAAAGSSPYNISTLGINTLSQLVTNEVNKALTGFFNKLFKDKSLRFDFGASVYNSANFFAGDGNSSQGNNRVDRSRFNFKVNKSLFDNKVIITFGSDIDFNLAGSSVQSGNLQWLPDLNIEFILSKDRKLRAILFNKNSLDISGSNFGRRNRTGASISYRRDFESIWANKEKQILLNTPVEKKVTNE
ncbi:MAG: hypothetical protein EAZ13_00930 [Sphingobacteriia bacterium]|nr:MAG: hypothetical protein EAZ13_00930 [Sphingobacteriia bacterium]